MYGKGRVREFDEAKLIWRERYVDYLLILTYQLAAKLRQCLLCNY